MFTGLQHIPLVGGGLDYYANYLSDPQGAFS